LYRYLGEELSGWIDQQVQRHQAKKCAYVFVGIDNPLVLKTDTQETENLDQAIFS
jgi:hypothetical protein